MRFIGDDLVIDRNDKSPLQVLCAGLPRCATSSIQAALESQFVGLQPCMHMAYVVPHADRSDILLKAIQERDVEKRRKLLYLIFDGFQATADFPGCAFIDDLMDMYPDAKIILNKRPGGGESWAKSIAILSWAATSTYYAITFLWKTDRNLHNMWIAYMEICREKFGFTQEELFTAKHYAVHNAWVHAEAAKRGREVLEYEPVDGWGPICGLVGKEAPKDEPFPHRNDASEIRTLTKVLYARGVVSWLVLAGVTYGAVRWLGIA
ncbi:hypothetical protein N7456_012734 [Penicillium angulare]|uniref:Uncharacterized protein n=1 Tax=Penicillium angulare TaxID=116970 RepID=A0A9W9EK54_9EURO|nr:hypothetical protein N7456_012734 [Penicillium angulare]